MRVARSAVVSGGVVIGRWSSVGNHSKLLRSSIGRRCKIGANVTIVDSHVWDDAVIEDNAVVRLSVICSGATVKKGAKINKGCILSYGTVVGEGTELAPFTRLTLRDGQKEASSTVAGPDGKGLPWKYELSGDYDDRLLDDDGDSDGGEDTDRLLLQLLMAQSMGSREEVLQKVARWGRVPEPELDDGDADDEGYDDEGGDFDTYAGGEGAQVFGKNVCDMVTTGFAEGHPADNVLMEIKGYKFSQNKSFQDCLAGVFPGLVAVILQKGTSKNSLLSFSKTFFQRPAWGFTMLKSLLQTPDDE